jgi:anti-sigma B factor antagonist/stage II sporulation protein AA (anti-sigma F factor antagonist)
VTELVVDSFREGPVAVLAARGELDMAGSMTLDAAVERLAGESGVEAILLDLSAVSFMDSSGLRAVMVADRLAAGEGLRFALVRGGEPVHRVFDITRMTERLKWVTSAAELRDGGEGAA